MTATNLTLLNALATKMSWEEDRQMVLAQNIANANTPGYKPMDLTPLNFKNLLQKSASALPLGAMAGGAASSLQMALPESQRLGSGSALADADNSKEIKEKKPYEVKPDGNAVILEEQLVKMNKNFADHSFVTNLYQKNIAMLEEAVK